MLLGPVVGTIAIYEYRKQAGADCQNPPPTGQTVREVPGGAGSGAFTNGESAQTEGPARYRVFQYSSAGPRIVSSLPVVARTANACRSSALSGLKLCAIRTSSSSCPTVVNPNGVAVTPGRLHV